MIKSTLKMWNELWKTHIKPHFPLYNPTLIQQIFEWNSVVELFGFLWLILTFNENFNYQCLYYLQKGLFTANDTILNLNQKIKGYAYGKILYIILFTSILPGLVECIKSCKDIYITVWLSLYKHWLHLTRHCAYLKDQSLRSRT